jgi:hypothetical protein
VRPSGRVALTIFSNHTPAKAPTTALAITAANPSIVWVSRPVGGASGFSCTRITPSTSSRMTHHCTDEMRLCSSSRAISAVAGILSWLATW